jgi:CRISPR-associated protein Cas2
MAIKYIVAYDVGDNKRRRRLSNYLGGWGNRLQESVFVCRIAPNDLLEFVNGVNQQINEEVDHVAIIKQCAACEKELRILGDSFYAMDELCFVAF